MQCLWLRLLWHYRSYINTNMLVVASRRLLTVVHLTFDFCIGFDLLHSRKCSPLTHLCASKRRVYFHCKIFQFGKPIYAGYFLEALYGLAQGSPNILSENHYRTVWGPDIFRNRIVSGYVTFYKISTFFVNTLFFHYWQIIFVTWMKCLREPDEMSSWAGWNVFVSRMKCLREPDETSLWARWNIFVSRMKCLREPDEMSLWARWNLFVSRMKCLCEPDETSSWAGWNLFVSRMKPLREPDETSSWAGWNVFVSRMKRLREPHEMSSWAR